MQRPRPEQADRRGCPFPSGKRGPGRSALVKQLPISKGIAGVSMMLEPGAMRELHWHASADWEAWMKTIEPLTLQAWAMTDQRTVVNAWADIRPVFPDCHCIKYGIQS